MRTTTLKRYMLMSEAVAEGIVHFPAVLRRYSLIWRYEESANTPEKFRRRNSSLISHLDVNEEDEYLWKTEVISVSVTKDISNGLQE